MSLVRPGQLADAPAIAAIEASAAHRPWSLDAVQAHLIDPSRRTLVVLAAEAVVGHVLASSAADEGEILTIAVHPQARRLGLGRRLLHGLYARWAADGVRTAWLEVREDNLAARGLYQADGWASVGRRVGYYGDCDALMMRREVP